MLTRLGSIKRSNFSLRLEKNFDARVIGRVSIYMVHIGRIYLVIRTQNKAEASIWGVKMFYIEVSFGPQKITYECKLWCQSSYDMYVASHHWTTHTCCLLRAMVSNGMFYVLPLFVRSQHVASFLWAWHIYRIRKAN